MDHAERPSPADLLAALPRLRRYARVLVGERDAADALVEETLAGARARAPAGDLATWLFGLARAAYRSHPHKAPALPDSGGAAADICARLLRLPVDEREVLLLVAVERLSYADIAVLLDVPVASVLSTLARARTHLCAMGPYQE
jgi:RNA polymerase sigma-70 factor (ECF subfamily)